MNKGQKIAREIFPVVEQYILDTIHWQLESELTNKTEVCDMNEDEIYKLEQQIHNEIIDIFSGKLKF